MTPAEQRRRDQPDPTPTPPPATPGTEDDALATNACALAKIGGWAIDLAGGPSIWSGKFRRLLEVDEDARAGPDRLVDFCAPEARAPFAAALAAAGRDGRGFDLEVRLVTAKGRSIWVRALARVELRDGQPARIVGAFQDITSAHARDQARRRLELELMQEEKTEALETFAGGIAHDFNNLLTGIMGFHELIAYDIGENPAVRDYLAQARSAGLRARDLLEQILVFARQTAAVPHAPINLGAILEEVQLQLRAMLAEPIAVDLKIVADLPLIHANAAQIRLALINLGLQVARASAAPGGAVFLGLRRADRSDSDHVAFINLPRGDYACLTIANTHRTALPLVERRAFEQSFTLGEMRAGEGLDLAIVFRIVRAHRGALGLERDAGGGLEFRLYLPLDALAAGPQNAGSSLLTHGHGEKILVVNDESAVATFMKYALEGNGYRVTTAVSPTHSLEMLTTAPAGCDLLVTDQSLTEMTGLELASRVRKFAPHLPVILISGKPAEVPADLRTADRPTAVLGKPFTTDALLAAVHHILHREPTPD